MAYTTRSNGAAYTYAVQAICSYTLLIAIAGLLSAVIGQQPDADGVTGFLLVYPACLLVCLEVMTAASTGSVHTYRH
jgi:hypothetical protein